MLAFPKSILHFEVSDLSKTQTSQQQSADLQSSDLLETLAFFFIWEIPQGGDNPTAFTFADFSALGGFPPCFWTKSSSSFGTQPVTLYASHFKLRLASAVITTYGDCLTFKHLF